MKKVLLSLLLAIAFMPSAFSQSKAGNLVQIDTTACGRFTWIDNVVYTHDTVVLYGTDSCTYVLNLTMLPPTVDTAVAIPVSGNCVALWNNKEWRTQGEFIDTVQTAEGCDNIVKIAVTLLGNDTVDIDTTVCDRFVAPWGATITDSAVSFTDSTIVAGNCTYLASLNLIVNRSVTGFDTTIALVDGCSYTWHNQVIRDNVKHYDTLQVAATGCDSIVSIKINRFSGHHYDTVNVYSQYQYVLGDTTFRTSTNYTLVDTTVTDCDHKTFYHIVITPDTTIHTGCDYVVFGTDTIRENGFRSVTDTTVDTETIGFDIVMVHKFVIIPTVDSAHAVIVDTNANCSLTWYGETYTVADDIDTAYHLLQTTVGNCDSVVGLHLVFSGVDNIYDTVNNCGRYTWPANNQNYTVSGDYTATATADGCTTHNYLHLTIANGDTTFTYDSCYRATFKYKAMNAQGLVETRSARFFEDGSYVTNPANGDTLFSSISSITNCKVYATINVTVTAPEQRLREVSDTACNEYKVRFNSRWRTFTNNTEGDLLIDSTITVESHFSPANCYDSIGHFLILLHKDSFVDDTVTECNSYTWPFNGLTYTSSTTVTKKIEGVKDVNGCDSTGRLVLTINYSPDVHISGNWNIFTEESSAVAKLRAEYTDSTISFQWFKNGAAIPGEAGKADSLELEVSDNTDIQLTSTSTKGCTTDNWITITLNVGIDEAEDMKVNIYPNPASRYLNLECAEGIGSVTVYNALGQEVLNRTINGTRAQLDLGNLVTGTYTLRVSASNGEQTTRKFIVNK